MQAWARHAGATCRASAKALEKAQRCAGIYIDLGEFSMEFSFSSEHLRVDSEIAGVREFGTAAHYEHDEEGK